MPSLSKIIIALSLAVGPALAGVATTGDMTYYAPGTGSCGGSNTEKDSVVALSKSEINGNCGKTIKITRNGKSASGKVVDTCSSCATGAIDVSPAVFDQLANPGEGKVKVDWEFA
ncbi:riboflavine-aldehyde-forming enzyme [Xylaria nigripes]|nr:riboflavine-aldehyde-forming enzyme [Xylaria nigripes]